MKLASRLLVLFILIVLANSRADADAGIESLGWLSGCWAVEGAGAGTGETWTRPAGGTMLGLSRTVRDGRTTAYEYMRIEQRGNGDVYLVALPSGQAEAEFRLSEQADTSVTFENPEHDFPQRIRYSLEGEVLRARVEAGEGNEVRGFELEMRRVPCPAE